MKDIEFSSEFKKKLKSISKKNKKLYTKVQKQLHLFLQNPKHRSLRIHKLKGKLQNLWSISVDDNYRMIYHEDQTYYFIDIGTHNEVYERN